MMKNRDKSQRYYEYAGSTYMEKKETGYENVGSW